MLRLEPLGKFHQHFPITRKRLGKNNTPTSKQPNFKIFSAKNDLYHTNF